MINIAIKKPILVTGISISFLLWIGQNIQNSIGEIGDFTILGLTSIAFLWIVLQRNNKKIIVNNQVISSINLVDFQKKISQIKSLINTLMTELKESNNQQLINDNYLSDKLTAINNYSKKNFLDIVILSNNKVSPYSLKNILKANFADIQWQINTNILSTVENIDLSLQGISLEFDLVLFIIHGDVTESEKTIIEKIINNHQKIILLFNDIDYSLPEEKTLIFNHIKTKLKDIIDPKYILQISTVQSKIKVKKYQDEINYEEWEETSQTSSQIIINTLATLREETQEKLILLTAYRNAINLEKEVKEKLNFIRKEKALPLIEKYQLITATATFANPVSSLDLLATAAINTQMILDLSSIYQQPLSINQSKEISINLAKLMVQLGIVEVSSQAITALLKTNTITFVAGGIVQGISSAYLTKICGLSLIEYYETTEVNNENINLLKIKEKLPSIFQKNKSNNLLVDFVKKTYLSLNPQHNFN